MTVRIVWGDEYQGERFTYRSPLRPVVYGWLGKGVTVVAGRWEAGESERLVTVTAPLSEGVVQQWGLELVEGDQA